MCEVSWTYANTNNARALRIKHHGHVVTPQNEFITERAYAGDGMFGGQDVFALVAKWNRKYLSAHPNFRIPQHGCVYENGSWKPAASIPVYKFDWYHAYADLENAPEDVERLTGFSFRDIGVAIAYFSEQNASLPYPIKISSTKECPVYLQLPASMVANGFTTE